MVHCHETTVSTQRWPPSRLSVMLLAVCPSHLFLMSLQAVRQEMALNAHILSDDSVKPTANGEVCELPYQVGNYTWQMYFCNKGYCPTANSLNSTCFKGMLTMSGDALQWSLISRLGQFGRIQLITSNINSFRLKTESRLIDGLNDQCLIYYYYLSNATQNQITIIKSDVDGVNETIDTINSSPFNGWIRREASFFAAQSNYKVQKKWVSPFHLDCTDRLRSISMFKKSSVHQYPPPRSMKFPFSKASAVCVLLLSCSIFIIEDFFRWSTNIDVSVLWQWCSKVEPTSRSSSRFTSTEQITTVRFDDRLEMIYRFTCCRNPPRRQRQPPPLGKSLSTVRFQGILVFPVRSHRIRHRRPHSPPQ